MSEKAKQTEVRPDGDGENPPDPAAGKAPKKMPKEYGGPKGPEPTRYGDWQHKGIVSDF